MAVDDCGSHGPGREVWGNLPFHPDLLLIPETPVSLFISSAPAHMMSSADSLTDDTLFNCWGAV